ncbi:glycosyltransferase family 9 protein [Nocardia asteroides]|uniref:glycosyltransferase family 9 protein n=1 Tax=Nocardia asteroides TaxID=1824 RepID=UPI001E4886AB|nr:glycosyltransferase family 9 protein [Nocardia asteroides]UGT60946.1 glycosyltransferase family 9 protein [Nocardia asteroides]
MGTVLALRALGLGDLLTAVPALKGLRAAYPGDRLVLAAPAWLRPLAELTGGVDEVHPTTGLGALRWPGPPPALAVNLHGSGPRSIDDLLAPAPERLVTHRHPDRPRIDGPDWDAGEHEVRRWCLLLERAGIPCDPSALALESPGASPVPGCVVVHPGGSSGARRWPPARFAAVVRALSAHGLRVVVTGSAAERALAEEVGADLPPDAVRAGRDDLAGLAALVAGAALVVTNDTGVGHLATAYGTRSVLIFGPNPPAWWGPPPDRPQHTALWSGEIADPHGPAPTPGLLAITIDDVLTAARTHLTAATH